MTNLEALRANISDAHGVVLTQDHFVKALLDEGLVVDASYSNETAIDRATIRLYNAIIGGANLSEGSLAYNVNIESVMRAKGVLEDKLGTTDRRNQINVARPW